MQEHEIHLLASDTWTCGYMIENQSKNLKSRLISSEQLDQMRMQRQNENLHKYVMIDLISSDERNYVG